MRKYGKFERMPDGTRAKQPKVKNVLLQTYFTSLLCMVLCVSMFFGTSYAWFTSEVNNVGNEIYIGTLKAGLDKNVGTDGWKSLSDKIDGVNVTNLFDKNIRWEPGYTSLETIRVTNQGDLAFKYTLYFTDGQIANDTQSDLAAVAGNFDVWIFDHHANKEKTEAVSNPASYDQITEANGWTPIGTLADVLNGKAVLENKIMETVRKHDSDTDADTPNSTDDGVMTVDTYIIALHMKEEASDNSLMGKKIVLNVKLVAYQMGHEEDAFGNTAYDDAKFVTTAKELQAALDNATDDTVIRFANDITGDVTVTQKVGVNIVIDGCGYKYDGTMFVYGGGGSESNTETLTIKNVKFAANETKDFINCDSAEVNKRYAHNITIENCTFTGTYASNNAEVMGVRLRQTFNVTVKNCTAEGMYGAIWATGSKNLVVENVTAVGGRNGISVGTTDATIKGCKIDAQEYGIRADGTAGNTLKVEGCEINAKQPVIIRKLTAAGYVLNLAGNTLATTATGSEAYQLILTTGSDDEAYVQPTVSYALTGAEGLNTFK